MRSFLAPTVGAQSVENGLSAVDLKAVLLQKMQSEGYGIRTVEVLYFAASGAFFMEMPTAIAMRADVLIDVGVTVIASEFAHGLFLTKLRQAAIDAAFSTACVSVDCDAKLLRGKLTVGMRGKVSDQLVLAFCTVGFLFHWVSFIKMRMVLKL